MTLRISPALAAGALVLAGCASPGGSGSTELAVGAAVETAPIAAEAVQGRWLGYLHCQGSDFWLDTRVSSQNGRLTLELEGQPAFSEFPMTGGAPAYDPVAATLLGSLDSRSGGFKASLGGHSDRGFPDIEGFYLPGPRAFVARLGANGRAQRQWQACSDLLIISPERREWIAEALVPAPSAVANFAKSTTLGRLVMKLQSDGIPDGPCTEEAQAWLRSYVDSVPQQSPGRGMDLRPQIAALFRGGRFQDTFDAEFRTLPLAEGRRLAAKLLQPGKCGLTAADTHRHRHALNQLRLALVNAPQMSRNLVITTDKAQGLYRHWLDRAGAVASELGANEQDDPKALLSELSAMQSRLALAGQRLGLAPWQYTPASFGEARHRQNRRLVLQTFEAALAGAGASLGGLSSLAEFPTRNLELYAALPADEQASIRQRIGELVNERMDTAAAEYARSRTGVAGYQSLGRWQTDFAALAGFLTAPVRKAAEGTMAQRRAELVAEAEARLRRLHAERVLSQPAGSPEALAAGVAFEQETAPELGPMAAEPALAAFRRERDAHRRGVLHAAVDRLVARAEAADSVPALQGLQAIYLLDRDRSTPAGRALLASVGKRERVLAPFLDYPGGEYLNALYGGDFRQVRQLDLAFSEPYRSLMQNDAMQAASTLVEGLLRLGGVNLNYREYTERKMDAISLIVPVFATYLIHYEHSAFRRCMDDPVRFRKTVTSETVYRNGYGAYQYSIRHPDEITFFHVPARFADVFRAVGLTNPDSVLGQLVDSMFGRQGRINAGEVVSGVHALMERLPCDGAVVRRLEGQMLSYFEAYAARNREALGILFR